MNTKEAFDEGHSRGETYAYKAVMGLLEIEYSNTDDLIDKTIEHEENDRLASSFWQDFHSNNLLDEKKEIAYNLGVEVAIKENIVAHFKEKDEKESEQIFEEMTIDEALRNVAYALSSYYEFASEENKFDQTIESFPIGSETQIVDISLAKIKASL